MIRYFFIALAFILANKTYAETTGADWWKNCPGPACPARNPGDSYENADKASADRETKDRENFDKEQYGTEKPTKSYEKGERMRDINR